MAINPSTSAPSATLKVNKEPIAQSTPVTKPAAGSPGADRPELPSFGPGFGIRQQEAGPASEITPSKPEQSMGSSKPPIQGTVSVQAPALRGEISLNISQGESITSLPKTVAPASLGSLKTVKKMLTQQQGNQLSVTETSEAMFPETFNPYSTPERFEMESSDPSSTSDSESQTKNDIISRTNADRQLTRALENPNATPGELSVMVDDVTEGGRIQLKSQVMAQIQNKLEEATNDIPSLNPFARLEEISNLESLADKAGLSQEFQSALGGKIDYGKFLRQGIAKLPEEV